jgi:molybdopterin converting factor subunit 1
VALYCIKFTAPTLREEELNITVLYFASYRDQSGIKKEVLQFPDNASLGDVVKRLCESHKKITTTPKDIVAAVNEEYQKHSCKLADGDVVALIPPVSGGE